MSTNYLKMAADNPEGGIKCKNHELCGTVLPDWWWEVKGKYICTNCDCMFGTWGTGADAHTGKGVLEIKDSVECPICLEDKRGISQSNCSHYLCIGCFKRCYYGEESSQPAFPYPEIEDEYDADPYNPKWISEYPLLINYGLAMDVWEKTTNEKYKKEENLRSCPLCRK